jgi:hypothetical protein
LDKSSILVGATIGSITAIVIFSILFILPTESDETAIQMQNQIDKNQ